MGDAADLGFDRVPKVELHLHLEGAIPHRSLWELIQKYGGDPEVPNRRALDAKFAYTDFPHFIDTWVWKNRFLREYEDFVFLSEAVARDLSAQNVRYVEMFYSPADFHRHGLETLRLTEAIRSGLDKVADVEIALIADLVRDFGPVRAETALSELNEAKQFGVIGIGLGGSEHDYPPELFEQAFRRAHGLGFRTTAHAGEAAGAESVWGAIRHLEAERIGHGTRAVEDEGLLDHLADCGIPVEMCPVSNLRTGVVAGLEDHPVRHFFERGIHVTVNTDDPKMFGTSLAEEYERLVSVLGFSRDEVLTLILNAVSGSWLQEERKVALAEQLKGDPAWSQDAAAT